MWLILHRPLESLLRRINKCWRVTTVTYKSNQREHRCGCLLSHHFAFCAAERKWSRCRQVTDSPPCIQQLGRVQNGQADVRAAPSQRLLLEVHDHGRGSPSTRTCAAGDLSDQVTFLLPKKDIDRLISTGYDDGLILLH